MPLRPCSGQEAVKKLQKAGWTVARQKGSHVMMVKSNYEYTLSIPQHKELGPGIVRKLIRQAGLSIEEFNAL
ncbi:MAG TPA: type II toxin-antitoxin system HicA family toxin [Candidatus Hypogeohydataceae bacterium YC41]